MEDGEYQATALGDLTIHGITREVQINGTWSRRGDEVVLKATFQVALEDYRIKIPKILFSNIAEQVEVDIQFTYKPHEVSR